MVGDLTFGEEERFVPRETRRCRVGVSNRRQGVASLDAE